MIGRKDPIKYLQDRVEWAGEDTVRERMKSHLVDFDLLAKASYEDPTGDQLTAKLAPDFQAFLNARAKLVHRALLALAEGKQITAEFLGTTSGGN